jgi:hypothetical protein
MVAALHSCTNPTWLRFGGSGSLVESKWYNYVKVESDSHLKLLPLPYLIVICVGAYWYAVQWHTVAATNSHIRTPRRHLPPCQRCHPCCAGIDSHHTGAVDCAGTVNLFVLASLPSLCWHCCPCGAGVVDLVALMLPLSAAWSTTWSTA